MPHQSARPNDMFRGSEVYRAAEAHPGFVLHRGNYEKTPIDYCLSQGEVIYPRMDRVPD